LYSVGLIWKKNADSSEFMVTSLLSNFLYGKSKKSNNSLEKPHTFNTESNLNLIVETNFRIYAYTNSKLHIKLLKKFAMIEYLLPNLVVANLTEDAIKGAYNEGITKEQIIKFLNKNIHKA
jgi:hypothetical protein